jgi:hypothetical protein
MFCCIDRVIKNPVHPCFNHISWTSWLEWLESFGVPWVRPPRHREKVKSLLVKRQFRVFGSSRCIVSNVPGLVNIQKTMENHHF